MIYTLKIVYGDDLVFTHELDTDIFNITYSDMTNEIRAFAETTRLSFGTINGEILLGEFWQRIKDISVDTIHSISLEKDGVVYKTFTNTVTNIIYNINFNGPGDMIIVDYELIKEV